MCLNWMNNNSETVGIYVHIPFCVRKCAYCDFLSFSCDREKQSNYVNALCKQIDATDELRPVASVYFGGGTPSIIKPELIGTIMDRLKANFMILPQAEITIEINPHSASLKALKLYRSYGFNRLSMGLQSANDEELKNLGRPHSFDDFLKTFNDAKMAGFDNINVDIMTALPCQNEEMLNHTIDEVLKLKPRHISAYSLILEEGTPFYEKYKGEPVMDSDDERRLYYLCRNRLIDAGYEHYEISNFALPGYFSRHNTSYWKRVDYYGFGLGASSLIFGHRIKNESDFDRYLINPLGKDEDIILSKEDMMEEYMFLGLRMIEGIETEEFERIFSVDFESIYKEAVKGLLKDGLIASSGGRIWLTDKGIDYGNYVFSSFLL